MPARPHGRMQQRVAERDRAPHDAAANGRHAQVVHHVAEQVVGLRTRTFGSIPCLHELVVHRARPVYGVRAGSRTTTCTTGSTRSRSHRARPASRPRLRRCQAGTGTVPAVRTCRLRPVRERSAPVRVRHRRRTVAIRTRHSKSSEPMVCVRSTVDLLLARAIMTRQARRREAAIGRPIRRARCGDQRQRAKRQERGSRPCDLMVSAACRPARA